MKRITESDLANADYGTPPKWRDAWTSAQKDALHSCLDHMMNVIELKKVKCPWMRTKDAPFFIKCCKGELDEVLAELSNETISSEDVEDEVGDVIFSALLLATVCARDHGVNIARAIERTAEKVAERCPYVFDPKMATDDPAAADEMWGVIKERQVARKAAKRAREV